MICCIWLSNVCCFKYKIDFLCAQYVERNWVHLNTVNTVNTMDTVSIEILHYILDYVAPMREADSQAACLRVCKLWRDVVKRVAKPIHDTIIVTHAACTNNHDQLLCWLIHSGYRVDNMDALNILRVGNMRLVRCLSKYCSKYIKTMLYRDDISIMCTPRVVKYLVDKMDYQSYAGSMFVAAVIAHNFPVAEMLLKHYDPYGKLSAGVCPLAIGCRGSAVLDWALGRQCPCNVQEIINQTRYMPKSERIGLLRILAKHYPADLFVKKALNAAGVFDKC